MPAWGCKFHEVEERETGWKPVARICGMCGTSMTFVTTLYSVWPDGSRHDDVAPTWICYSCVDRANAYREQLLARRK